MSNNADNPELDAKICLIIVIDGSDYQLDLASRSLEAPSNGTLRLMGFMVTDKGRKPKDPVACINP